MSCRLEENTYKPSSASASEHKKSSQNSTFNQSSYKMGKRYERTFHWIVHMNGK